MEKKTSKKPPQKRANTTKKNDSVFWITVFGCLALIILIIGLWIAPNLRQPKGPANNDANYLTLVNKQNKLPGEWNFRFDFDTGRNSLGELYIVESNTLKDYEKLRNQLMDEEGIQIELDSTYRSLEEQQEIWDEWSADPELGPDYCAQYLSPVGHSEHHTGLAIDIFLMKDGKAIRDNEEMIAAREDFARIHKHLAEHGFILRYLEGRDDITGYSYEPWHLRYVGDAKIAKYIMDNNLTLEEYLSEKKN